MSIFYTSDQIKEKPLFLGRAKVSNGLQHTYNFNVYEPQTNVQIKVCNVRYNMFFLLHHMRLTLIY